MGKAIYRKLSNEEALEKYGRSSFVFVAGSGLASDKSSTANGESSHESGPGSLETWTGE